VTHRLAFLGNDPWSVPSLEAIGGEPGLDPIIVITNPPRPAGRGGGLRPTAVSEAASRLKLPLLEAPGVSSGPGLERLVEAEPEAIVVVAYGELLTPEVLAIPTEGAINLHFSLLPRWRGAAPVQHALLAGDRLTGITVMQMDEGLDTGPILSQLEEEIRPDDDSGTLGERLARSGARLLVGVLLSLGTGSPPPRPQDVRLATVAPKLGREARLVDWGEGAESTVRRIRALSPEPGATTTFRGEPLKLLRAAVSRTAPDGEPGEIAEADDRGVLVAAADGGVWLNEVAPAGRRRMTAAEWARGARFQPRETRG
jgi:methionyl-tRNA formyltransferase